MEKIGVITVIEHEGDYIVVDSNMFKREDNTFKHYCTVSFYNKEIKESNIVEIIKKEIFVSANKYHHLLRTNFITKNNYNLVKSMSSMLDLSIDEDDRYTIIFGDNMRNINL